MEFCDSGSEYGSYYRGPPVVSRSAFRFKEGKLFAEFEGRCHNRADATELHRLLTYTPLPQVLTKAGTVAKRQPKDTHIDPDPHFYSVQMIHYGLKPLKTKIAAKKRLLAAFGNGNTLRVPEVILDLERSMREEWQVLDSKYQKEQEEQRKIRAKLDEEARIERLKWEEARQLEHKPLHTSPSKKSALKSNAIQPTSIQAKVATVIAQRPKPTGSVPKMTNEEIKDAITSLSAGDAHKLLISLLERIPAVTNALNTELATIMTGKSGQKTKETAAESSEWTGIYEIEAPMIAGEGYFNGSTRLTMEIYPSSTSSHLWASLELGVLSGVMRSLHPVPKLLNTEVFFDYRGHEAGENVMTFSDDNCAILTFLPGGLFEGKINTECFGTFKLYGALQTQIQGGKSTARKSVAQQRQAVRAWKREYRSINYHNYEVANRARWGKWGGDTSDDKAFESDTTDGRQKRKKVDLHKFMKKAQDEAKSNGSETQETDEDVEDDSIFFDDQDEDDDEIYHGFETVQPL